MNEEASARGFALIKRCAWLGAKIRLWVMVPLAILIWLSFCGLIVYKSFEIGVSPLEVFQAWDARAKASDPAHNSGAWGLFFMPLEAVVVMLVSCTITGVLIGAAAAGVKALRGSKYVPLE